VIREREKKGKKEGRKGKNKTKKKREGSSRVPDERNAATPGVG